MNGPGPPETAPAKPVRRNAFNDLSVHSIGWNSRKGCNLLGKVGADPGKLRFLLQYLRSTPDRDLSGIRTPVWPIAPRGPGDSTRFRKRRLLRFGYEQRSPPLY